MRSIDRRQPQRGSLQEQTRDDPSLGRGAATGAGDEASTISSLTGASEAEAEDGETDRSLLTPVVTGAGSGAAVCGPGVCTAGAALAAATSTRDACEIRDVTTISYMAQPASTA